MSTRSVPVPVFAVILSMAAALLVVSVRAAPRVRITAPADGSVASGETELKADVTSTDASPIRDVTFYVDGRVVCRVEVAPWECVWDAGVDVKEHVVRVVARGTDGTRAAASIRTGELGYVDRVDVDAVQLAVVVTDREGRFVRGLPREAFRLFEDDKAQAITSFASENAPLELVAAVDVSQSMTDAMPQVKSAARAFLGAIGTRAQVTLLAFNDNIFTLARRTTSPDARLRAVDRLAPWGGTALYDAIIKGVDMLGRQPGRRALIVFSDGEDQSSHAAMDTSITRVESTDAIVYPVGLGRANQVPSLRALLERLAKISGGRGLFPDRADDLQTAFDEILQDLSNQYLIGYQPTNQNRDGAWRRLRVDVNRADVRVRHREGYRLGTAPAAGAAAHARSTPVNRSAQP